MIGSTISFNYVNYRQEKSKRRAMILSIEFKATEYHPRRQWIANAWDFEKLALRDFAMSDMKNVVVEKSLDRIATRLHHSHTPAGDLKDGTDYCCGCWSIEQDATSLVARCNECDETRDLIALLSPAGVG